MFLFDKTLISGLIYCNDFLSKAEEVDLIKRIDQENWLTDLKRRVQHYGYKYDYRARRIDTSMHIGHLPSWLDGLAQQLYNEDCFDKKPDQVIINEYLPGQGISAHIDCEPCFADTIVSISLGSYCVMEFSSNSEKIPILLEPRSVVVLKGESRYKWTHAILPKKKDIINGISYERARRISLTFRKVII